MVSISGGQRISALPSFFSKQALHVVSMSTEDFKMSYNNIKYKEKMFAFKPLTCLLMSQNCLVFFSAIEGRFISYKCQN